MAFGEHSSGACCGFKPPAVWWKSAAAPRRSGPLAGGKRNRSSNRSHSPLNNSPFLLHVMSGNGFPLTEHLMWTSDPIIVSWLWGGSVSHFGGSGGGERYEEPSQIKTTSTATVSNAWKQKKKTKRAAQIKPQLSPTVGLPSTITSK